MKSKPAKMPEIKSTFALLDVTKGRAKLDRLMPPGSLDLTDDMKIPVTIHGYISHRHGSCDGISQEFGIDVETVEIMEPYAMATKSIGRATVKTDATGKAKLTVPDTTPKHFKVAKRNKATRKAAGLVKNREGKRK